MLDQYCARTYGGSLIEKPAVEWTRPEFRLKFGSGSGIGGLSEYAVCNIIPPLLLAAQTQSHSLTELLQEAAGKLVRVLKLYSSDVF